MNTTHIVIVDNQILEYELFPRLQEKDQTTLIFEELPLAKVQEIVQASDTLVYYGRKQFHTWIMNHTGCIIEHKTKTMYHFDRNDVVIGFASPHFLCITSIQEGVSVA